MRIEVQLRTREMHAQAEFGIAAHWAYKHDAVRPDTQVRWIRDLIEILDTAGSPEELLEHTRMAMYQDRIFAFTPAGELFQLPKGATPIDFAYRSEEHTSELQSLMRISYAVFCLKKKTNKQVPSQH